MFLFAILFFGILTDAGLVEPLVRWILRVVGRDPLLIVPGTALLALLLHLDGSGAVVFLIAIPTMLPLYLELGMDRRILACATSLAAGVNFLPWTGPTLRAASALHTTPIALVRPLIPVQIIGLVYVFAVAFYLGLARAQAAWADCPCDVSTGKTKSGRKRLARPPGRKSSACSDRAGSSYQRQS